MQQSLQTNTNELIRLQEVNANLSKTINANKCTALRLAEDLVDEKLTSSGLERANEKMKEEVSILKTEKEKMESSHKAKMDTLQNELSEDKNKYKELMKDNQRAREKRRLYKESTTSARVCFNCKDNLLKSCFSKTQWKKGLEARCVVCVKNDNK